jgi:predicted membrane protein
LNVSENFSRMFWPAFLIIMGVVVVFKARFFPFRHHMNKSELNSDFIDEVAIFGGNNRFITSEAFKGGKITSIFGGSKIDLSTCKLAEGVNVLEVTSIFGGTNLKVPSDWNIKMQVASIFGGFEDKRYPTVTDTSKTLIIKGAAIFGGGEVRNGRNVS